MEETLVTKLEKIKLKLEKSMIHEQLKDAVKELVDIFIEHEQRDEFEFEKIEGEEKHESKELHKEEKIEEKESE